MKKVYRVYIKAEVSEMERFRRIQKKMKVSNTQLLFFGLKYVMTTEKAQKGDRDGNRKQT